MISSCARARFLRGLAKRLYNKSMSCLGFKPNFEYSNEINHFYEKVRNQHFYETQYKSSNLKFENQGMSLVGYQSTPQLAIFGSSQTKVVKANRIVSLFFVPEIDESMNENPWNLRKTIIIDMKTAFQMFKLSPTAPKVSFQNVNQDDTNPNVTTIDLEYKSTDNIVEFSISMHSTSNNSNTHLWDLNFVLTFGEYLALTQWIKVNTEQFQTGLFYTSGTALMLEHQKMIKLKHANFKDLNTSKINKKTKK